ncbi:SulP family inorganic anion transporter [Halomonas cupida]|uniref:SulP family inorganic anion transporter n=1 Tax=Halomonas cupida TaxID=44933 RepID=UPI0013565EC7
MSIVAWLSRFVLRVFGRSVIVCVLFALLVLPDWLACALLGGLAVVVWFCGCLLAWVVSALLVRRRCLAVGAVCLLGVLSGCALSGLGAVGCAEYLVSALVLSLVSGLLLVGLGFVRLVLLSLFLSHRVVGGFLSACGLLFGFRWLSRLVGFEAVGSPVLALLARLALPVAHRSLAPVFVLFGRVAFLCLVLGLGVPLFPVLGLCVGLAALLVVAWLVVGVVGPPFVSCRLGLVCLGVARVGRLLSLVPGLRVPDLSVSLCRALFFRGVLLSVFGFVSSVSLASMFSARGGDGF